METKAKLILDMRMKENLLVVANAYLKDMTMKDQIESMLLETLPHGSGIDCNWEFNITKKYIICSNSFHVLNENGYYDGYIDFSVKIHIGYRDIRGKLDFNIFGRFGKYQDLKDYLYEIIGYSLENL